MKTPRNQRTLANECEIGGTGYWSGNPVRVRLRPAPPSTGIVLVRGDLPGQPSCPAHVQYRDEASLRTNLVRGDARFQMVEHVMAALYAMEVDNAIVEIDGEEFPGLDGSSQAYTDKIQAVGTNSQPSTRRRLVLEQMITLHDGDAWITASPVINNRAHFGYELSFDHAGEIPNQCFHVGCTPKQFRHEVGPARTFVTETQAKQLQSSGVATHVTYQDLLVFGSDGVLDNRLRFANECARHKTLDLIGDLALAGVELIGKFVSHRGGHRLNGRMAEALFQLAESTQTGHRPRAARQAA
ncbi:MAG: UDP-3-O-acyl-N-acetylglucosamine deacetylase [Planctomycetota bacterium]